MERYETADDDNLSDESASLYTSDELYLDDASDNEKEISSEGEESFLPRTRRRIIPASEFLTCTAAPDFSASQALGMFQETCCMDYGRWQYGSTSSTGDDFPQFHLDMGSLVGLPLRSVILEGSSSANGDNGLDLALCESITRLEKWMTKYGIEDGELCPIAIEYGVLRISCAMLIPSSKGTLRSETTVELGDHFRNIQLPPR